MKVAQWRMKHLCGPEKTAPVFSLLYMKTNNNNQSHVLSESYAQKKDCFWRLFQSDDVFIGQECINFKIIKNSRQYCQNPSVSSVTQRMCEISISWTKS